MTPYVEELVGYRAEVGGHSFGGRWKPVEGTQHKTGDDTPAAVKAHQLVKQDADLYHEVADDLGEPCDVIIKPKIKNLR